MPHVYFGVFLGELSFCLIVVQSKCHNYFIVSDAANSRWSMEGVTTVSVDEDKQMRVYNIVCKSSHFTAFAVLMDVTGALNVSLVQYVTWMNNYNTFGPFVGHNSRDQVCSIVVDLCRLFHLHLFSSVNYHLFSGIEVIIEKL